MKQQKTSLSLAMETINPVLRIVPLTCFVTTRHDGMHQPVFNVLQKAFIPRCLRRLLSQTYRIPYILLKAFVPGCLSGPLLQTESSLHLVSTVYFMLKCLVSPQEMTYFENLRFIYSIFFSEFCNVKVKCKSLQTRQRLYTQIQ